MSIRFDSPLARELEGLLYKKLTESENGQLSFDQIIDIFEIKPDYGLRRVNSGAIQIIRSRPDVEQAKDERNHPYLKLIKNDKEMK